MERKENEPVLGFDDLPPDFQKLAVVMARLNADEMARRPPLLSGWLNTKDQALYRGMSVRGIEQERRGGRGPTYSATASRNLRCHVDDIDAYYRDNMIDPEARKK